MPSIFTQIISGQIPCYKVYEDEHCLAFLDVFPISYGHTLVIPKQEFDHWINCPPELYQHLQVISQKIAKAIFNSVDCLRVGMIIDGREVPHTHIHLVPILEGKKINEKTCPTMNKIDFEELSQKISSLI
jgi:histidine triad (HIT) family protein